MIGTNTELIKYLADAPQKTYKITEYHQKRSLSANSYYWTLLSQLADVLRTSKEELHEQMLRSYSYPMLTENGDMVYIVLSDKVPLSAMPGHWQRLRESKDNIGCSIYYQIKGSHDMDSREMSRLLDGLISEIEEMNRDKGRRMIEVIPPAEIARLRGYVEAQKN